MTDGWLVSPVSVTLSAEDALSGVRSIAWRIDGGTTTTYGGPVPDHRQRHADHRVPRHGQGRRPGGLEVRRVQDRHQGSPVITLEPSGTAGDAPGTWRGPVTRHRVDRGRRRPAWQRSGSASTEASRPRSAPSPIVIKGDGAAHRHGDRLGQGGQQGIDHARRHHRHDRAGDRAAGRRRGRPDGDAQRRSKRRAGRDPLLGLGAGAVTAVVADADAKVVRTITASTAGGEN